MEFFFLLGAIPWVVQILKPARQWSRLYSAKLSSGWQFSLILTSDPRAPLPEEHIGLDSIQIFFFFFNSASLNPHDVLLEESSEGILAF